MLAVAKSEMLLYNNCHPLKSGDDKEEIHTRKKVQVNIAFKPQ